MNKSLEISLGSDHAGFELKTMINNYLVSKGYKIKDFGTHSSQSVDYPDFVHPVARAISKNLHTFGILICGSGNGVAMTANKHTGIRAALCWTSELAELSRQHNDANILCLPGRFINFQTAIDAVEKFLNTSFEGGRHLNRIRKIDCDL